MKRSQLKQALETIPDTALFGSTASHELTPKQKRFAREVAKGATKADAYRRSYKAKAAPRTIATEPYKLAANPAIAREIEAYRIAIAAEEYRSPANLRALITQTLTQTILDPETPPSVRVQAAKVLGSITEVAAFTHRTETTVIKKSDDAKAELLKQLQLMMNTVDEAGTSDAETLLMELAGAHRGGDTPNANATHHGVTHSNPDDISPEESEVLSVNAEGENMETPLGGEK